MLLCLTDSCVRVRILNHIRLKTEWKNREMCNAKRRTGRSRTKRGEMMPRTGLSIYIACGVIALLNSDELEKTNCSLFSVTVSNLEWCCTFFFLVNS